MPATGKDVESLFAVAGLTGDASCRMQSLARSQSAPGTLAPDEPGPNQRRFCPSDPGISRPHAGDAAGECYGRSGSFAEIGPDSLYPRRCHNCEPHETPSGLLRMPRDHYPAIPRLAKGIRVTTASMP